MDKIKNIHTFGTSFTAGGGYEFDSSKKREVLYNLYKHLDEELTRYNFSWPGQLNKLLKSHKIQVHNHAESGYGNQRLYRYTYDTINSKNFNKDETLFIFEFSGVGRQEIFLNSLNDYIIFNFKDDDHLNEEWGNAAHRYFYDDVETINEVQKSLKLIRQYHEMVYDYDERYKEIERTNTFFLRYLESLGINYLISQHPYVPITKERNDIDFKLLDNHSVYFNEGTVLTLSQAQKTPLNTSGMNTYFQNADFTITRETFGRIKDGHASLLGNKNIAINMFNNLIKYNFIQDNEVEVLPSDTQFCNRTLL